MNPRLSVITGPLKNSVFALGGEEFSIGRDSTNQLSISDRLLSRRHCLIKREDERFIIRDLASLNSTYVNGVPVTEGFLEHGDLIAVGDSRLVFLLHAEDARHDSHPVQVSEQNLLARTTVRLKVEDALYSQPASNLSSLPPLARMARDLT
ncbi:MAG: FHA domain-containing protein, partial [Pyrinomonadaceae bacterium]